MCIDYSEFDSAIFHYGPRNSWKTLLLSMANFVRGSNGALDQAMSKAELTISPVVIMT